jgi:hypothetical protein
MKRLLWIVVAFALAGCAIPAIKVGPGSTVVGDKMTLSIDSAWNHLPTSRYPWTVWTADGVAIDELRFWPGLKDGEALAPTANGDQRPLNFKATMQAHELVALFGSLYARDGSTFTLDKLEPADFVGVKGFRFRYSVVRYYDDVKLSGVAWAAVRNNELYAMTFTAPRIGFFPRYEKRLEQIAKSARLKS